MIDVISEIDYLIEKTPFLIDIFPEQIPPKADNRYFEIEDYFQSHRAELNGKLTNILLKLYCYYDFLISAGDNVIENPAPSQLVSLIDHCFEGEWRSRDYINVILPECHSMIILNGDDLYMTLYNPDEQLKDIVFSLVHAEGLFFYKAHREP